jgi:hypothetical protein
MLPKTCEQGKIEATSVEPSARGTPNSSLQILQHCSASSRGRAEGSAGTDADAVLILAMVVSICTRGIYRDIELGSS